MTLDAVGGDTFNTIVVDRTDLSVPVERDLDGDPLQDDEVWLKDAEGKVVRRLLSTDADVSEDSASGYRLYCFRELPFGVYSVWVNLAGQPYALLPGVVVRAEGAFVGDERLDAEPVLPPRDTAEDSPAALDEGDEGELFVDQDEEEGE